MVHRAGFETSGKDSQTDSVFGITETESEASEGLYGEGRFGYSINDKSAVDISATLLTQLNLLHR